MRLEPVLAAGHGLVRVPGLRVDRADDPVPDDALRDAPVGAIRALDRFDVLARDQGQQRQRLGRLGPMLGLGQAAEQPVRVTDQRLDELLAGLLLIPGDPRLPGVP